MRKPKAKSPDRKPADGPCRGWLKTGSCPRGDECIYPHCTQEEFNAKNKKRPKRRYVGVSPGADNIVASASPGAGGTHLVTNLLLAIDLPLHSALLAATRERKRLRFGGTNFIYIPLDLTCEHPSQYPQSERTLRPLNIDDYTSKRERSFICAVRRGYEWHQHVGASDKERIDNVLRWMPAADDSVWIFPLRDNIDRTTRSDADGCLTTTRAEALSSYADSWDRQIHLGEVPILEPPQPARKAKSNNIDFRAKLLKVLTGSDNLFLPIHRQKTTPTIFIIEQQPNDDSMIEVAAVSRTRRELIALFDVDAEWLIDTGCGKNLVAESFAQNYAEAITKAKTVRFNTATGDTPAVSQVLRLESLHLDGAKLAAYILQSTPSVISIGEGAKYGVSFLWLTGFNPCFIASKPSILPLDVQNDVPYLRVDGLHRSCNEPSDYAHHCGVYIEDGVVYINVPGLQLSVAAAASESNSASSGARLSSSSSGNGSSASKGTKGSVGSDDGSTAASEEGESGEDRESSDGDSNGSAPDLAYSSESDGESYRRDLADDLPRHQHNEISA